MEQSVTPAAANAHVAAAGSGSGSGSGDAAAEACELFAIEAHADFVRSVRFNHQKFVSCGDDGKVNIFSRGRPAWLVAKRGGSRTRRPHGPGLREQVL